MAQQRGPGTDADVADQSDAVSLGPCGVGDGRGHFLDRLRALQLDLERFAVQILIAEPLELGEQVVAQIVDFVLHVCSWC